VVVGCLRLAVSFASFWSVFERYNYHFLFLSHPSERSRRKRKTLAKKKENVSEEKGKMKMMLISQVQKRGLQKESNKLSMKYAPKVSGGLMRLLETK
jgi:hypothetical protein